MLDRDLKPSSRMFEFVFSMMSSGRVSVPAKGMGAIPAQIAEPEEAGARALEGAQRRVVGAIRHFARAQNRVERD